MRKKCFGNITEEAAEMMKACKAPGLEGVAVECLESNIHGLPLFSRLSAHGIECFTLGLYSFQLVV